MRNIIFYVFILVIKYTCDINTDYCIYLFGRHFIELVGMLSMIEVIVKYAIMLGPKRQAMKNTNTVRY